MNYTAAQKQKTLENLNKITDYIEQNILPYIPYCYETGCLGHNPAFYIGINGPYADKIRFYCGNSWYNKEQLVEYEVDAAVKIFLKCWQDAKSYFNNEIKNGIETMKLIENFEI